MDPNQAAAREDTDREAAERKEDDEGEAHEDAVGHVHAFSVRFLLGGKFWLLCVREGYWVLLKMRS